jgi:hypothetical protein
MMFLKINKRALLERIEIAGGDLKDEHKTKIENLLFIMSPSPSQATYKEEFKRVEQWEGMTCSSHPS